MSLRGAGGEIAIGLVAAALAAAGLIACGDSPEMISDCQPAQGIEPICGFDDPEDLAVLPGDAWLLVSQIGKEFGASAPGSLVAFRPSDGARRTLFPRPGAGGAPASPARGASDCPGPPPTDVFGPHGIDVTADGAAVYVVNHGGREAVEIFALAMSPAGPSLSWAGCVPVPGDALANDVAAHPAGGFVVSHMMGRGRGMGDTLRLSLGWDTGRVLRWSPGAGWSALPGSEASGPNGIALSPDGNTVFFTAWGSQELVRIPLQGGEARRRKLPVSGDNISWTRDGALLVAGQHVGLRVLLACRSRTRGTCPLPFGVLRVDPVSLEVQVVLDHDPARVGGAGSSAVELGDALYVGSFAADRLLRLAP